MLAAAADVQLSSGSRERRGGGKGGGDVSESHRRRLLTSAWCARLGARTVPGSNGRPTAKVGRREGEKGRRPTDLVTLKGYPVECGG